MAVRTPLAMLKQALAWHRVVMQEHDTPVPDSMPIRTGGCMAAKKPTKTEKKVAEAFHEVTAHPPSTVGKNQTKAERQKQMTAIALNKARAAGADIPEKPKGKKSSRASY